MAHTDVHGGVRPSDDRASSSIWARIASMLLALTGKWKRTISTQRAIAGMTPDQLDDIGYRREPRPTLIVKAGLLTNLSSMR